MRFPEEWAIRPERSTVLDPSTGNRRPGPKPVPVSAPGLVQQRWPRTEQSQVTDARTSDERMLLLDPVILKRLGRDITTRDVAIGPDGGVWRIVRLPLARRRVRGRRDTRFVVAIIHRASDIKET